MSTEEKDAKELKPGGMVARTVIIVALLVAVAAAVYLKGKAGAPDAAQDEPPEATPVGGGESGDEAQSTSTGSETAPLPRLVDLGRGQCIPCKMMAPILAGLKKEYEGRMRVQVIDLTDMPEAGRQYAIRIIPTQIFFNAQGKELFRHEGFMSKEDILAKWKEVGIDLSANTDKE